MFDVITFKSALLWWLVWITANIACYAVMGAIYYKLLIIPILEMLS